MSIPTFSNSQNLGTIQPTPSISTREFTIEPGFAQTLKIVGTSVYVSQCYTVDAEGFQIPAAVKITLGHQEPFLAETGTTVEYKYYGTPFNEISIECAGTEKIFLILQIGYMLECRKGEAGTAGSLAILQDKLTENKKEIERLLALLEAIGPANATDYGLVKYFDDTLVSKTDLNQAAAVRRTTDGQMMVQHGTTNRPGVYKLGTANQIELNAGMVGKTASGALAVRFAGTDRGGVVFLASNTSDNRANAVLNAAQIKALIDTLNAKIESLENSLANVSTGATMILSETVDAAAHSLSVPIDAELNGEVSVETNAEWLSADAAGNISVEENSNG